MAFQREGDLVGQLKLNGVPAKVSQGAQYREYPGQVNGAEVHVDKSVPGCSMQGCFGVARTDAGAGSHCLGALLGHLCWACPSKSSDAEVMWAGGVAPGAP